MKPVADKTAATYDAPAVQPAATHVDHARIKELVMQLQSQQNFGRGALAGIGASLAGALVWALITAITNYQIGWMAVGVGFLVGISVRKFGKGIDKVYGFLGAALSLLGCLLGNIFTIYIFVAREESISFFAAVAGVGPSALIAIMAKAFSPIDLLFYGIALYEGYRFSFVKLTPEQIKSIQVPGGS